MHTSATLQAASDADAEDLAALHVRAMQPSLEQPGRFEPRPARTQDARALQQRDRHCESERDQHRDRDHRCLHAQPDRIDKFPIAQHRLPVPQRRLAKVRRTGPERRGRHEDQRQQGQQRGQFSCSS